MTNKKKASANAESSTSEECVDAARAYDAEVCARNANAMQECDRLNFPNKV